MATPTSAPIERLRSADTEPKNAYQCGENASPVYFADDHARVDFLFQYHQPRNATEIQAYQTIREAAKHLAHVILHNVPAGADRTAAIRKLREAAMTANAGISNLGVSF
jgi:hypothetical protein